MFDMMKKAQQLQSKMQELQKELESTEIEGMSGAGMVTVTLNGKGEMRGLTIDDSLFAANEKDVLEDLIIAAHKDAKTKAEEEAAAKMKEVTGDLPIPPGLKLF
ncbi:MAG: nucleoid-associated protein [Rhodomicrobium sp.]|nr:MAG: nucleoid-associated protein [Rhodomicrobium sp.]